MPPDTKVCQVYGQAGQICHKVLEDYAKDRSINPQAMFDELWDLNETPGLNGKPLNKAEYFRAVCRGVAILDTCKEIKTEDKIEIPFVDNSLATINIKGIIDLQVLDNNELKILDWKTGNKEDCSEQMIHYAYCIWKKYKIMPSKLVVHFLRIDDEDEYNVNETILKIYEKKLKEITKEIVSKGFDKDKYDLGDWESPFNAYKKFCEVEYDHRKNKTNIEIVRSGAGGKIKSYLDDNLLRMLVKHCSYEMKNSHFIQMNSKWDGRVRLFNANKKTFPIGMLSRVERVIKDYENFTRKGFKINYVDTRVKLDDIKTPDILKMQLREYQTQAVNSAIENEMGVLHLTTATGKTAIAIEVIRKFKKKTLFTIDRIELVKQTQDVIKGVLELDVGLITEGKLEDKDICVATYQTIMSLLKKKDPKINEYLESVGLWISDETHIVAADSFLLISSKLINTQKRIGLSATNFRDDGNDMKIEACVGKEIFRFKEEAFKSGFISTPDITFIKIKNEKQSNHDDYASEYNEYIVENIYRNDTIRKVVLELHKDKQILVLTKLINHAKKLSEMLGADMIVGSSGSKQRAEIFQKFKNGEIRVLVGTVSIFSKGIDLPELDMVVNCVGNSAEITTIQSLGRVLRKTATKNVGYYIDFIDEGTNFLKQASWKRFHTMKKEGHEPKIIEV
jgi:superfamily II DNA or RNA helicase